MVLALRRWRDPGWGLLAALSWVPAAVFLQHAIGDRVQANWPSVIYPAAAIAAAGLGSRWVRPGIALGLGLTVLVWVQGAVGLLPLPMRLDPTLLRVGGWSGVAAEVDAARGRTDASFVAADNYGLAAMLAWLLPPGRMVLGVEDRWARFDLPDARPLIAGRVGILLRSARREGGPDPADWSEITQVGEFDRARDGMTAERFRLYRVVGRAAGSTGTEPVAVLPRPR